MKVSNQLCINRIMKPHIPVSEFIQLAVKSGVSSIELRNDLANSKITDEETSGEINTVLNQTGVKVLTINALQRFNDPELIDSKITELRNLMEEALEVNCKQIILCPVCDPKDKRTDKTQTEDLIFSLREYAPLFEEYKMIGLLEPLGFSFCSLRYKKQAVDAIELSGHSDLFRVVHDTFHHYLADEKESFAEMTGLIHISSVYPGKNKEDITDEDRIFIDKNDVVDNKSQIIKLIEGGCKAPISFEPFSKKVQEYSLLELEKGIRDSINFIFN